VKRSRTIGRVGQVENPVICAIRDGLFGFGGKLMSLRRPKSQVKQSRA
jgi:hypothetical protein